MFLITSRRSRRSPFVTGSMFAAAAALLPAALFAGGRHDVQAARQKQTAQAENPGRSEFPYPDVASVPFVENTLFQAAVPISRIYQDAAGNSDSTRDVNYLTSAAELPTGGSGDRWLGTRCGVKRLRTRTKTVRYYTQADGLPGDYVEAVAANDNGSAAWCLVRVGPEPQTFLFSQNTAGTPKSLLAFCVWNAQTDKWRVVREIPPSFLQRSSDSDRSGDVFYAMRNLNTQQGKSVVVSSPNFVCFAPGVVSYQSNTVAYVWDKKREQIKPITWGNERDGSPPFVGIHFLWMDELQQTLWLGTSHGLHTCHLPDGKWRTFFPNHSVRAGAPTPDKTALYVSARENPPAVSGSGNRLNESRLVNAAEKTPMWRLVRVNLASGASVDMPPVPTPPDAAKTYFYNGYNWIVNEPIGLFVDDHNAVWATFPRSSPYSFGYERNAGGIYRFDVTAKTWRHIVHNPTVPRTKRPPIVTSAKIGERFPPFPPLPDTSAKDADPYFALLDTVPDAALAPLALSDPRPNDMGGGSGYYGSQYELDSSSPVFWIRHRFPQWYGANDEAASATPAYNPRPVFPDVTSSGNNGADAAQSVWLVQNNDTLTRVPRAEVFPLEATFSALRPPVLRVVSAATGLQNPVVLVQSSRALYAVDTIKNDWKEVAMPAPASGGSVSFEAFLSGLIQDSSGVPLFQITNNGKGVVFRWNAASGTFEADPTLPVPQSSRLVGAGQNGAVWFLTASRDALWYQSPSTTAATTSPAPVRVAPTPPEEWHLPNSSQSSYPLRPVAAWGSRVWYKVPVRSDRFERATDAYQSSAFSTRDCLAGYDITTQKWTAPLPLPRNIGEKPAVLQIQNRIYAGTIAGNPNGSVWEWSDTGGSWQVVAPPLPPEPGLFNTEEYPLRRAVVPVAVDDNAVWVMVSGRMMARYDRALQKWQSFPLPSVLRDNPEAYFDGEHQPKCLQAGPNAFCIGSEKDGLWQLHLSSSGGKNGEFAADWKPVGRQVTVRSRPNREGGAIFSLSQIVVTPRFVWGIGYHQTEQFAFAARLDKQTKTWTTWDEQSGFPMHDHFSGAVADGDTIWVTGESGTYRFDPITNRWTLLFRANAYSARVPEQAAVFTYPETGRPLTGNVVRMADDKETVYLLLSNAPEASPNTLLWRWDKASHILSPLSFPSEDNFAIRRGSSGFSLLNEAAMMWVGTSDGIFAWNKETQKWSLPPVPAGLPPIKPYAILRSQTDAALLLVGSDSSTRTGTTAVSHVIRLIAPPFLKRP